MPKVRNTDDDTVGKNLLVKRLYSRMMAEASHMLAYMVTPEGNIKLEGVSTKDTTPLRHTTRMTTV